jgi:spore coat polysaccharide biosynthesis predicted glycosyltransferase SpsG
MKYKELEIYILTEGGQSGCGHIARCSALYEAFVSIKVRVKLIINSNDSCKVESYICKNWLNKVVVRSKPNNNTVLIMDSYHLNKEIIGMYRKLFNKIILIDDALSVNIDQGVVINPTNYFKYIAHKCKSNVSYIKGSNLILLRKEFWRVEKYSIRDSIGTVTITMGANDFRDISFKLALYLNRKFKISNLSIITNTDSMSFTENFKKFKNIHLRKDLLAGEMRDLMFQSDLVISGGGQTLYELARIGVPTVAICLIKNQAASIKAFVDDGYIQEFIQWNDADLMEKVRKLYLFYKDKDEREKVSIAGKRCVDGMGAIRLADKINKLYNIQNG